MVRYEAVTSPRWFNAAHTGILCEVVFPHVGSAPVTFHASGDDTLEHGRVIFEDCRAGKYGPVAAYVAPVETAADVAAKIDTLCRDRIAAAYGNKRLSYLSYFSRVAGKADADRSSIETADLAVMITGDEWEEAMLAKSADLATTCDLGGAQSDASWPSLPSGMADMIAAC